MFNFVYAWDVYENRDWCWDEISCGVCAFLIFKKYLGFTSDSADDVDSLIREV